MAALVGVWAVVSLRMLLWRVPGTRPITIFIAFWAAAATIATPAVTSQLQTLATPAFWLCLLVGDLLGAKTVVQSLGLRRPHPTFGVGFLVLASLLLPIAPKIGNHTPVPDLGAAVFLAVASVPLTTAVCVLGYVAATRIRVVVGLFDKVLLTSLVGMCAVGLTQLVGLIVVVAGAGAVWSGEPATSALAFVTSGTSPLLYSVLAAILIGLPGFRGWLDPSALRAIVRLTPLWRDLTSSVDVALVGGVSSAHERRVWMEADIRDAVAALVSHRRALPVATCDRIRQTVDSDLRAAAFFAAELAFLVRFRPPAGAVAPMDRSIGELSEPVVDPMQLAVVWRTARSLVNRECTAVRSVAGAG